MPTHSIRPAALRSSVVSLIVIAAFTLTACVASAASPELATPTPQPNQTTLKLDVIAGVPVVNGVYLNGQGPYRFLLDTGSTTNQVEAGLAKKLGLTGTRQLELATVSGLSQISAATVQQVALSAKGSVSGTAGNNAAQLDTATVANQEFMLVNDPAFHALDPSIRGMLGQQFLSHFDYMLAFKHHRLILGQAATGGDQVKFRRVAGCMAVTTDLGELLLDSGTQTLFIFQRAAGAGAHDNITTSNGQTAVSMKRAPSLSVAGKRYYPTEMATREVAEAPAAGLMPANLFHSVYVSNSQGYVVLNPAD